MIFTGSREWGEDRPEAKAYPPEWIEHELDVSAKAVARLVGRWVTGKVDGWYKKVKAEQLLVVEGLVVIQGGARGLDTHVANITRLYADGLRRLSRAESAKPYAEPHLAEGLWLETYHADWDNRPRVLAGPERNQRMLDAGADHVIALFAHGRQYSPEISGGTNDMVRRAVAAGVPVDIYVANDRRWRKP